MRKTKKMLEIEKKNGNAPIEQILADTLNRNGGNMSAAAESLGLPYDTFSRWVFKFVDVNTQFIPRTQEPVGV